MSRNPGRFGLYLFSMVWLWAFGAAVFVPLAHSIDSSGLTARLIAAIFTVAFSYSLFKAYPGIRAILKKAAKKKSDELLYSILFLVIVALAYYPLLAPLHPAIYGLLLVPLLTMVVLLLLRYAGTAARR